MSPSTPQMGLATAIDRPDTLADAAVHRSRSWPGCTPRSCEMKIDRNGNAKLNPKMAVNSANHKAARLRRQSTSPARVLLIAVQELDDPVRRHRQVVDDRVRPALAKRVLDGVGDRSGHRNGAALPGALEVLRIRVGGRFDVNKLWGGGDLSGADDRVIEEARRSQAAVRVVQRRFEQGVAEAMCIPAEQLAFQRQ